MRFEFATAARIVFGPGTVREVGALVREMGRRALVVTGGSSGRAGPLVDSLSGQKVESVLWSCAGEPTVAMVVAGAQQAREAGCDLVIGFGGGSAIDAAKAIAALATNPGDPFEHLEVVGRAQPLVHPPLPCVAIPTTAGTGAEVTRNAVLASPEHRVKASLRSPLLLPRLALVDPELTRGLPSALTAATGLDALTQLIEPFLSVRANPLTDALCVDGIRRAARSLRRACEDAGDAAVREDLSLAALFSGLALANAGLGAVHGFAAPIGGMFHAPHGAVCAALLPVVMEVNLRALREREAGSSVLERFDEVGRLLTGEPSVGASEGVAWIRNLCAALGIPGLSQHGIGADDLAVLVTKGRAASSMKGNPIELTDLELREILERAL